MFMEYTIKLSWQELDLIWLALGKLPYEQVVSVINILVKQIEEQKVL